MSNSSKCFSDIFAALVKESASTIIEPINEKDLSSGTLVVIAEKPSVAKLIASALDIKKVDVAKGLDCYESNEFVITSAVGHLVEYEKPKKKWCNKNLQKI